MDNSIGAYEAKTHLPALLVRVEKGEEITITRHHKAVAKLIPITEKHNKKSAHNVAEQIKKLAKDIGQAPFDWEEWKQYRDDGQK